jgi:phosphoribosylamine-glycine ligase
MNILLLTKDGDGFSLAMALRQSGNEVKFWTNNRRLNNFVMSGFLPRISLSEGLKWADLVVADMVGMGAMRQKIDKRGVPQLGLNLAADAMELDRARQMELLDKVGIETPPTYRFDDPTEALQILSFFSSPGYVIKPSGNLNTAKTMLAEDEQSYTWALDQFAVDQQLIVQKIVRGVEVSTEGWFNGKDWSHFNHTFEEKRFLTGSLGQNVGCMGNVVLQGTSNSALSQNLQKLTDFLQRAKYRGPVDLNTIVNDNGPNALEITPRLGYDAIEALWAMSDRRKFSEFLWGIASGRDTPLALDYQAGAAVRLSLPPYPMSEPTSEDRGLPISFSTEPLWSDAYKDRDTIYWAAFDGVLAKAVGFGDDPHEAITEAYRVVEGVTAMNLQYRTDIGKRVPNDLLTLQNLGAL